MDGKKPKILIIYTGGTIGMIENPVTHVLQPFDFTHLIDNVPKVKMLDYDIANTQFNPPIDSANMSPIGASLPPPSRRITTTSMGLWCCMAPTPWHSRHRH